MCHADKSNCGENMDKDTRKTMREHGLTVDVLARDIKAYADELATYDPKDIADDDGNACGDIRLQLVDGSWALHTGDAQYDTDHRGWWGASAVEAGASLRHCRELATALIGEAVSDMAWH
jgi:hypothetical protein